MDDAIPAGTVLYLPDKPKKIRVVEFYRNKNIIPVSEYNSTVVRINQPVSIVIDGIKYSEAFSIPNLSGSFFIYISLQNAYTHDSIGFDIFTSFDGNIWTELTDMNQFGEQATLLSFKAWGEGEFIKIRFREILEITQTITNIEYEYEKYF